MKVRKLKDGELIQVGDKIKADHLGLGIRWGTVTRVTKAFAFVKVTETYESKYRRVYREFGFGPLPQTRHPSRYSAWRPV